MSHDHIAGSYVVYEDVYLTTNYKAISFNNPGLSVQLLSFNFSELSNLGFNLESFQ